MSKKAIYLEGSIYKHILSLTFLGMVGLLSRFFINALNIYFVGKLDHHILLISAVGVSQGYIMLFFSMARTATITVGMRVGFLFGEGKIQEGKTVFSNLVFAFLVISVFITIFAEIMAPYYFEALGVTPDIMPQALLYARLMLSTYPTMIMSVIGNSGLAMIGKPQVNTVGMIAFSLLDAILTYILMIHFPYGLVGLAIANNIGRMTLLIIVWYPLVHKKAMFDKVKIHRVWSDFKNSLHLSIPTLFSQISNAFGMTISTKFLLSYDPVFLAGFIAITKIFPLAYCFEMALGGAFSTIFAQNLGAKNISRLYEVMGKAILLGVLNMIIVTVFLGLIKPYLIQIFKIDPKAYEFFDYFVHVTGYFYVFFAISNIFTGVLQNIRKAVYATIINIMNSTVGAIFFIWLFQLFLGARGVLLGKSINNLVFAVILTVVGLIMLRKTVQGLKSKDINTLKEKI